jgi:hypothetical protein
MGPLRCVACGAVHPSTERFCEACGIPLVFDAPTEAQVAQVKVRRELAQGELVRVAGGRNQAEAELIQGLLLEEGVPSLLRRSMGFDVPDMLAAGPRDVLVPASGVAVARQVLLEAELVREDVPAGPDPRRILAGLLLAVVVVVLVVALGAALAG